MTSTICASCADSSDVRQLIAGKLPYLSPALRQLGEYILATPDAPQTMTISELARAAGVADSTVSRFTSKLGLGGYHALKLGMAEAEFARRAENGAAPEGFVYENVTRGDSVAAILAKLSGSSRHSLDETARHLDVEALEAAVELVERAHTMIFTSMGSSSLAAENAVGRFTRAGKRCVLERDQALQVMTAMSVDAGDLVIGISDSGRTTLVIEALRLARLRGAPTLAITSDPQAPLVEHADVTLFTARAQLGRGHLRRDGDLQVGPAVRDRRAVRDVRGPSLRRHARAPQGDLLDRDRAHALLSRVTGCCGRCRRRSAARRR